MSRSLLWQVLAGSGPCIDRVRLIERGLASGWLIPAMRYGRLRFSPAILEDALRSSRDVDEAGRLFSLGMSFLGVRGTCKTTGDARTGLADEVALHRAGEFDAPGFLEVGASDGSASAGLLEVGRFSRFILTDRHNCFYARSIPGGSLFLDAEARLLGIKWLCFNLALPAGRAMNTDGWRRIGTLNPAVASRFGVRAIERFDMFRDVLDAPVELIRCSNILNACYFSDAEILAAVGNLMRSLVPGGYLVISHNNEKYAGGEAVLSLQKTEAGYAAADELNGHELLPLLAPGGGA
ncbi:MAG: hypothetical protein V3571_04400 [Pseudodesulfovibrio sp.]